jgi:hypothetical protein
LWTQRIVSHLTNRNLTGPVQISKRTVIAQARQRGTTTLGSAFKQFGRRSKMQSHGLNGDV